MFSDEGRAEMGEYRGTKACAEIWGYAQATITKWCREGKIPGAEQDGPGSPWRIPIDVQPPKRKGEKRK